MAILVGIGRLGGNGFNCFDDGSFDHVDNAGFETGLGSPVDVVCVEISDRVGVEGVELPMHVGIAGMGHETEMNSSDGGEIRHCAGRELGRRFKKKIWKILVELVH